MFVGGAGGGHCILHNILIKKVGKTLTSTRYLYLYFTKSHSFTQLWGGRSVKIGLYSAFCSIADGPVFVYRGGPVYFGMHMCCFPHVWWLFTQTQEFWSLWNMKTSREDEDRKVIEDEERTKKMTFAPGFFDKSTLAWLSLGLILG